MRTLRGPGLFISQFIGEAPPFDSLAGMAEFAAGLGFKALQIPVHDRRFVDLGRLDEAGYIDGIVSTLRRCGLVVSEFSAARAGALLAAHPAYEDALDVFAAAADRGDPAARQARAAADLRAAIRLAGRSGVGRLGVFSGGLAWPFLYPYPPAPPGLFDRAFAELARRWRPLLDAAEAEGVDLCFELHPGQDLHDGTTFDRFLALVDQHPRARILYDPSHMLLQQMDYLGFIDRYHARIGGFHVKDAEFRRSDRSGVYGGYQEWIDRPGRFRSLGDGQVDFGGVFDRLTRYGFDGWAVLEWECCLKNAQDGAAEGARFIAGHIIRVGERPFDAGMRAAAAPAVLDRMLGLQR